MPDRTVWVSVSSFDWLTDARLKTRLPKHLESFGVEVQLDWATFHSSRGRLDEWAVTTGGPAAQREKYLAPLRAILESAQRTTAPTLPAR